VMDRASRVRLVGLARRHGTLLLEDASYAYLEAAPPPTLAALAPDLTVHVTGLSKSVATGLRVGHLAAPAHLVPALERAIRATTWNTPALTATIACRWMADGTVDRLEREKRADAAQRQELARAALGDLPHVGHPTSYFLWLPLPEGARADRVVAHLAEHRISVSTARHVPRAVRLALGSAPLGRISDAVSTVAAAILLDASR
jgi:DNA-binding transcriptional MocR family regulator